MMRRLDEMHLRHPLCWEPMLRDLLRQEGVEIGRLHDATLIKKIAIEAIYRRPNTSKPTPGHKIYLPLFAAQAGDRAANQVWATDIRYIPMFTHRTRSIDSQRWEAQSLQLRLQSTLHAGIAEQRARVCAERRD
jgi:hypothetical protein